MPHHKLIARLLAVGPVSERDRDALRNMRYSVRNLADAEYAVRVGDRPSSCTIVLAGFLSRQRVVSDRMQISSFYLAGDMPDLPSLHLPVMDHDLCSVGPSTIALVKHSDVRAMLQESTGLLNAFWRETLIQGAVYREWVDNLGARQALPRVAHLICEIATRLEFVGLVEQNSFNCPLTQEDVANACGLSIVHVNRTIQELRRRGLIDWRGRTLELLQRQEFEEVAEFDAAYLHGLDRPHE
ncbi:Crp/Fnr family transcriptional regulator [Bradyrhizobium sp. 192]|uniref:Crp/Fnr family transcriptional regulator n=1 Tax=Bradyrhizobium sp. 192 TaxID=2782660 RepID=UPI001FFF06CA|nr:Crp/Fnr family transcriptional regulator [Bradyrhizobium sp. 192]UPJ55962.1 Crp/Fnr family transcriptional regulator [Bradyrhizobium sp. 192]